jgi:hypothetical protein
MMSDLERSRVRRKGECRFKAVKWASVTACGSPNESGAVTAPEVAGGVADCAETSPAKRRMQERKPPSGSGH